MMKLLVLSAALLTVSISSAYATNPNIPRYPLLPVENLVPGEDLSLLEEIVLDDEQVSLYMVSVPYHDSELLKRLREKCGARATVERALFMRLTTTVKIDIPIVAFAQEEGGISVYDFVPFHMSGMLVSQPPFVVPLRNAGTSRNPGYLVACA